MRFSTCGVDFAPIESVRTRVTVQAVPVVPKSPFCQTVAGIVYVVAVPDKGTGAEEQPEPAKVMFRLDVPEPPLWVKSIFSGRPAVAPVFCAVVMLTVGAAVQRKTNREQSVAWRAQLKRRTGDRHRDGGGGGFAADNVLGDEREGGSSRREDLRLGKRVAR